MLCWVGSFARHQTQKNGIEERPHLALASGTVEVSYTPGCHGLWSRDFGFVVLIGALGLLVGKFGAGPSKKDIGIMENKMETTIIGYILGLYWGYIGIMEKKMETTIIGYILGLYWGYIGIMEKKMETTIIWLR